MPKSEFEKCRNMFCKACSGNLQSLVLVLWKMRMQDLHVDVHRIARWHKSRFFENDRSNYPFSNAKNAMISTCPRSGERPRPTRVHYPYNENQTRHNFKIRPSNGSVCPDDQLLIYRNVGLWSVRPAVGQPQSDFVGSLIELVKGMRFTNKR